MCVSSNVREGYRQHRLNVPVLTCDPLPSTFHPQVQKIFAKETKLGSQLSVRQVVADYVQPEVGEPFSPMACMKGAFFCRCRNTMFELVCRHELRVAVPTSAELSGSDSAVLLKLGSEAGAQVTCMRAHTHTHIHTTSHSLNLSCCVTASSPQDAILVLQEKAAESMKWFDMAGDVDPRFIVQTKVRISLFSPAMLLEQKCLRSSPLWRHTQQLFSLPATSSSELCTLQAFFAPRQNLLFHPFPPQYDGERIMIHTAH